MYINNVRDTIRKLDDGEYDEYLKRLRHVLRRIYKKSVKPSELKQRVDEFTSGKNPKIDYFEAYLLTFDEFATNGAISALHNKKIHMPTTWRQLLVSTTDDQPLSPDIAVHLQDEQILIQVKALFYNSVGYCKNKNKEQFSSNLYSFNNFLKIK
ncbi:hypothetical protein [Virgibacillus sp. DJP39]|uniref:hypothetical protein n=1 Tax=Virgibacillus sp. DJP39 TaxID=3409790 RepID=UPI003BB5C330